MQETKQVGEKAKAWGHCIHCQQFRYLKPRWLCWTCYYNENIRELYPAKITKGSKVRIENGQRIVDYPDGESDIMPDSITSPKAIDSCDQRWLPTPFLPGTEEKVEVLEERVSKGLPLWHPHDARREMA